MHRISDRAAFSFKEAFIDGGETNAWQISGALLPSDDKENPTGCDVYIPSMTLFVKDPRLESASLMPLTYFGVRDKKVHTSKEKKLYKSEYDAFLNRIFTSPSDIISFKITPSEKGFLISAEINFCEEEREMYSFVLSCEKFEAYWEEFGETVPKKKLTLKEKAKALEKDIPAMVLSIADRRTPAAAKIIAALAAAYALSPIDLIPDFIPVLGYLDDLLILSGLITLALKLIPSEVMEENRIKARQHYYKPKKRRIYALPIVLIWIGLLILIIFALMK